MKTHPNPRALVAAAVLGLAAVNAALADSDARLPRATPPAYLQECGSCYTAYPPGMLPTRSWQRIMNGLDTHYGSDASLDAAMDRITRSAWFEREHRKIDPAVWRHASVKSAANCSACHPGADRGRYDDDELRFPEGLDARYRRAWND